ncbi:MAG TPA: ribonuclease HII [Clostridia bacterium]|nr:ribonuclease HII [Clostridia bacterium]
MAKRNEAERLYTITAYERPYWERGVSLAGMDEAGRGPLAGPVYAACVVMPGKALIEGVNDSKKLSESRREALYPLIRERAIAFGIGTANEQEIDECNILNATKLAFQRAYQNMACPCATVLVDAVKGLLIDVEQIPLIHGDAISYLIAAASILAKVERDRYMKELDTLYPQYGFKEHKGYGTKKHIEALREYGPCPAHRRSFIGNFCGERIGERI